MRAGRKAARDRRHGWTVAVVGATGAVGTEILRVLAERRLPVDRLVAFGSPGSARRGTSVSFGGRPVAIRPLARGCFRGVDAALFAAGAAISETWAPAAVADGARVSDNSSAFRDDPGVPLVIPSVNLADIRTTSRLCAVPNCSTIILLVALKPLHDAARLRRVTVATYQAVSGAGGAAIRQLDEETRAWAGTFRGRPVRVLPQRIAFNLIPHVGAFRPDGTSAEEQKFVDESRRILRLPSLAITATAVRVPVWRCHSEAVWAQFASPLGVRRARQLLARAPGVRLFDSPATARYPMPELVSRRDDVWVGRVRSDPTARNGLAMFVVGDQLRRGAATTAVEIAERMLFLRDRA